MANAKLLIEDPKDYSPSEEEIIFYARQIGIDTSTEKHLLWIAERGLTADVPKPWLIFCDEKDRIFYYNPVTNQTSWYHPLDKEFAALVLEERSKSKSLNSVSSDYGFESKLSSLADAPPLSSSGKNSPLPPTRGKNDGSLSGRKFEFGHIENRRGTQLAPVRLSTLKMPSTTPKSGGISFMPKGAALTKKIRKVKEEPSYNSQLEEGFDYRGTPLSDSNDSLHSDEGSKYSYEETDDEGKLGHEPYTLDTSQLSPLHSADESPDALDINSLVQLGTNVSQKFDSNLRPDHISNKENSPSLSLRKVGQPSFLKPLSQTTKKKNNKSSKSAKKASKIKHLIASDVDYDDKISPITHEQRLMQEQIQKEWLAMQEEVEKQEKEKYEVMLKESSKKLEEEEMKLRDEHSKKILKIKEELQKKIDEEMSAAEEKLQTVKEANKEKVIEEEEKLQKELESLKNEIKVIQEKNAAELAQKKKETENTFNEEIENLKLAHESSKKRIEEAHALEISNLQESFRQKIEEMKNVNEKEIDEVKNKLSESVPDKSEIQEKFENLKLLIEEETKNYQKVLEEKKAILNEANSEKENLEKLKNVILEKEARIEELHDEIEKVENDLDLLRSEKSGLISELNILKENIKNEKSNLLNLEKKLKSTVEVHCSKEFSEVGINTHRIIPDVCKAIQVSVSCDDVSSQTEKVMISMLNVMCQTSQSVIQNVDNKACQANLVPSASGKNIIVETDVDKTNSNHADKHLENVLSGLSLKLDSRINVIEQQIRLLQENLSRPSTSHPVYSNQEFIQNNFTEVRTVPKSENQNIPPVYATDSSVPLGLFSNSIPVSSQNKCKCELGDSASCSVLQDVKNSVYRLNDILCSSFVPPPSIGSLYQVSHPVNNYSSPFESFYVQFRNMQEKQRLTEFKQKCDNEAVKLTKSATNVTGTSAFSNDSNKESMKPSYHLMHSSLYSYNIPEDPLIRAKNIVLKEQARAWKEEQLLNSSVPHNFSLNSSSASSQSVVPSFDASQNVPSSEQTFLNFEVDPEIDYNMWMTRLNALQLRIRSHKII